MFYLAKLYHFLLVIAILVLCSCAKNNTSYNLPPVKVCTFPDNPKQEAPLWVCHTEINGYPVTGVGNAAKSKAGMHFMLQKATTLARAHIAQELKTYIESEVKTFIESNKIGDAETIKNISSSLTTQITQNNLIGSKILRTSASANGVLYVLVGLNKENYQATLKDIFNKAYKENNSKQFVSEQQFSTLENKLVNTNTI